MAKNVVVCTFYDKRNAILLKNISHLYVLAIRDFVKFLFVICTGIFIDHGKIFKSRKHMQADWVINSAEAPFSNMN